jgi:hypothetical protein
MQDATLVRVGNRGAKAARSKSATPRAIEILPIVRWLLSLTPYEEL